VGEPFRPVAPVDPTNLRPMLFLDVAPQGFRRGVRQPPLPLERMVREAPDTPFDVPMHPAAAEVWRQQGYL